MIRVYCVFCALFVFTWSFTWAETSDEVLALFKTGPELFNAGKEVEGLQKMEKAVELIPQTQGLGELGEYSKLILSFLYLRNKQYDKAWVIQKDLLPNLASMPDKLFTPINEIAGGIPGFYDLAKQPDRAAFATVEYLRFMEHMIGEMEKRLGPGHQATASFRNLFDVVYSSAAVRFMRAKDYKQARSYAETYVKKRDPIAMFCMGYMDFYGLGGPKDLKNGAGLLQESAILGCLYAMPELGKIYARGIQTEKNYAKAWAWYQAAVNTGKFIISQPGYANQLENEGYSVMRFEALAAELEGRLSGDQKEEGLAYLAKITKKAEEYRQAQVKKATDASKLFRKERLASNQRACFANQKTLMGALEMYSLDVSETMVVGSQTDLAKLAEMQYLPSLIKDPGNEEGADTYRSDSFGNVWCTNHGAVGECEGDSPECKAAMDRKNRILAGEIEPDTRD